MMFGPEEIFTVLFVMLGPLKLLGPFVQRTRGRDAATVIAVHPASKASAWSRSVGPGLTWQALHDVMA